MNALTGDAAARRRRGRASRSSRGTARSRTRSPRTRRSRRSAAARQYLGDKLIRVAAPHRLLDPEAGPLIAVRLTRAHPQDARRPGDRPVRRVLRRRRRAVCPACTRPARWPGSAAAACTATGRWRAPSSAAACSPAGPRAGRPPGRSDDPQAPCASTARPPARMAPVTHHHPADPDRRPAPAAARRLPPDPRRRAAGRGPRRRHRVQLGPLLSR